jgi:hypothetical protein
LETPTLAAAAAAMGGEKRREKTLKPICFEKNPEDKMQIFLQNSTVAIFVVIWQILFNHGLIRLKSFVSSISSKLCN